LPPSLQAVGIKNAFYANDLRVYPNPAKDQLFISTSKPVVVDEISILSLNGAEILSLKEHNCTSPVNTSQLSPGLYVIRVKTGEQTIHAKFVKQ
jgi:hypothetical protein